MNYYLTSTIKVKSTGKGMVELEHLYTSVGIWIYATQMEKQCRGSSKIKNRLIKLSRNPTFGFIAK